MVAAASAGTSPLVRVFDYATGGERLRFLAYENSFLGGVFVATGDVTGDGRADIVAARGVGGESEVRIFDGATLAVLDSFHLLDPDFLGGVYVG